jgi:hypothetical protein
MRVVPTSFRTYLPHKACRVQAGPRTYPFRSCTAYIFEISFLLPNKIKKESLLDNVGVFAPLVHDTVVEFLLIVKSSSRYNLVQDTV